MISVVPAFITLFKLCLVGDGTVRDGVPRANDGEMPLAGPQQEPVFQGPSTPFLSSSGCLSEPAVEGTLGGVSRPGGLKSTWF